MNYLQGYIRYLVLLFYAIYIFITWKWIRFEIYGEKKTGKVYDE
jgi:hypothetical protein